MADVNALKPKIKNILSSYPEVKQLSKTEIDGLVTKVTRDISDNVSRKDYDITDLDGNVRSSYINGYRQLYFAKANKGAEIIPVLAQSDLQNEIQNKISGINIDRNKYDYVLVNSKDSDKLPPNAFPIIKDVYNINNGTLRTALSPFIKDANKTADYYAIPKTDQSGSKPTIGTGEDKIKTSPETLTFGQTYALPPEYVNLYAQMAKGQKGNNQFKRQVIAGTSTGKPSDSESAGNSAGNFLGAIAQGASESLADNLQKWSSSETGKADFWNRIVPALEAASGRKITAYSPEQQAQMQQKYAKLQAQKEKLGESMDDSDLQNIVSSTQNLGSAQEGSAMQDIAKKRLEQQNLQQQNYANIQKQIQQLQDQAQYNNIDNRGIEVGNPNVFQAQSNIDSRQAFLDKLANDLESKMYLAQFNEGLKEKLLNLQNRLIMERQNGGNGIGIAQEFYNTFGDQTKPVQPQPVTK
ncbi:MAG: hypothetical protein HGB12_00240 [Bacteroidetes bacterium]|nr:hypothetical protein [Bacteroidota bacterium]